MKSPAPCSNEEERSWLILRLAGYSQAWGQPSRRDNRYTFDFPTKSGIVGMLGSALGVARDDEVRIAKLNSLHLSVFRLKGGVLHSDFQTTGGGCKNDKRRCILNTKGESRGNPNVSHRQYLIGADFIAVLEGQAELIEQCKQALLCPKHVLFLGRKNCLPTEPILAGLCKSEKAVMEFLHHNGIGEGTEYITDADADESTDVQMDKPIRFGIIGGYCRRFVRRGIVKGDIRDNEDSQQST
jgi:CRISPR system Cascade subunit CasD